MAIINRDLDSSLQTEVISVLYPGLVATGVSVMVKVCDTPVEVLALNASAKGISGAVTARLNIDRFGGTQSVSAMQAALAIPAYSVSGAFSASITAAGSSLTQAGAGDALFLALASGTNVTDLCVNIVVKRLQDYTKRVGV